MNIHGFITLTLLDYPEHLAASVFLELQPAMPFLSEWKPCPFAGK